MFAVTAESRKLMDQILASEADNAEVSSRVAALLAGSNLTTKQGVRRVNDGVQYDEGESSRSFCLHSIVSGPNLLYGDIVISGVHVSYFSINVWSA